MAKLGPRASLVAGKQQSALSVDRRSAVVGITLARVTVSSAAVLSAAAAVSVNAAAIAKPGPRARHVTVVGAADAVRADRSRRRAVGACAFAVGAAAIVDKFS